ncbi:MAG: crnA 2 [Nitrososphaeraceae archaeon]|nr:crnA 2 [Nitrososphaeraceae archaeon]
MVLPAIPYGVSLHHIDFQMTISLDPNTLIKVIEDVFTSLVKNGISRILIINGHDGNIPAVELALVKLQKVSSRHGMDLDMVGKPKHRRCLLSVLT